MAPTINERIFIKVEKVLGNLEELPDYLKLRAYGFMDLNVDKIYGDEKSIRIALNHYIKQNGNMIPDPDMEIIIFPDLKMVEPLTYQDSLSYREVFPQFGGIDFETRKDLNIFLNQWFSNIIARGYKTVAGDSDGRQGSKHLALK